MSVSGSNKIILENDFYKVAIHPFGAELQSLFSKRLNVELLWQAGSEWPKHSPVLFPIVGALKNDAINYNGISVQLTRHGFARGMNFKVQEVTKEKAVFYIDETDETLKIFPFRFRFFVEYKLQGETLQVNMTVKNNGGHDLYCSYGAHPAFRIPLFEGETFEDYQLKFNPSIENIQRYPLKNNLIADVPVDLQTEDGKLQLTHSLFETDAIVFKHPVFNSVCLQHKSKGYGIQMHCENWPYFGIWSTKNADFVCFEPWQGIADTESSNGELINKEGIIKIKFDEEHSCGYRINIV